MLAHDMGAEARPLEPPETDIRGDVNALLSVLGPLLLEASKAADGPTPRNAIAPIRMAARRILTVVFSHTAE